MSKLGCREVYFIKATQIYQIDFLIDKVKEVLEKMRLPPEYDIRVFKNVYASDDVGCLGLVIEVVGPEEEKIKTIDLRAMSRVLEFCEKEGYAVEYHFFGKHESQ